MGAIRWTRTYYAMAATPLNERDILLGHQLFVVTRVLTASAAYLLAVALFGAVHSWLALLVIPVAVLIGTAFSMPLAGYAATRENEATFPPILRFVIVPMFLFSGAFFPVSQMPLGFEIAAYLTPIWHGVELCRDLMLGTIELLPALGHVAYLLAWTIGGLLFARRTYRRRLFR
jgi:lipooligosaccharide transport system permease protein